MLRQYELVEKVRAYDPDANEDLLNRAYVFSLQAHGSQTRANGDPYFSHPVEVAGILTDLKLDDQTIATAILHDTVEDTVATIDEIRDLFGDNVARLVDGVTKLSRIEAQTDSERAAENLRKFLIAMSGDIRVLLVKLADRLHNMRTLHFIPNVEKRRRIAKETMDIYAPLAERIGMYQFMDEMKEISFRELEPEAYQSITQRLAGMRESSGAQIDEIASDIRKTLGTHGVDAEVSGREKRPFSIYKKMQERHIAFEQLSDVIAFRAVVERPDDCYRALGVLHQKWSSLPDRFKDFISTPKRNGYRSLHTTLLYKGRLRIEIQIRTQTMHEEAENGLAAHWAYKERGEDARAGRSEYPWINDLLEILDQASSPEEMLEQTRLAMYQQTVFCFTPKGELIQLPRGSTPVDFAFAVHTDVGKTTVGAKINGRQMPLRTQLKNGDQVEILRSEFQEPDPAWENFAATAKARAAVRRHIKLQGKAEIAALGQEIYEEAVSRLQLEVSKKAFSQALTRLNVNSEQMLYEKLGEHDITSDNLIDALAPGFFAIHRRSRAKRAKRGDRGTISIKGLTPGISVHLAGCCHPIPGDRIIGIRRAVGGIDVHVVDCGELATETDKDWLDLSWGEGADRGTATLVVVLENSPGALASVTTVLARADANIANMRVRERDAAFGTFVLDLEVDDLEHLTHIIAALRTSEAVNSVERQKR
ncbi:bifunctional (p)ppGpp synthetase/guanosine-3',5'-bis(diphosphate) 3'-pyrophosphohydrolase [Pacificimonas sp. WHA3]|uniref:GTP pyrophosphokinase rsh n=1 Tax=Pacificimonas pallii TaxID=2827236 RepID=A0ABS6SDB9_9SPHN|nr:bifunctional (p)ppGpp synthetase/guanosine-3',5'-bis(diphosphate) 3'-pyrophosphohydrolase [Pacificimonas pallii]MBV7256369.1 bifunctional (p)ppGpp synthetase/guanosine-3',5'-bis(diphosphate) 3'-pyrophosphohydrolase [Pacificimonas pallii]